MSGPLLWIGEAKDLDPASRYCTCCERPLKGKVRFLELDHRTGTYHARGSVPGHLSQGWHPFGMTCAKRKVKEDADCLAARAAIECKP